jgi:hypothetical protein
MADADSFQRLPYFYVAEPAVASYFRGFASHSEFRH